MEHAPAMEGRYVFTVTDLKQFTYCPRVVFYTYCLPLLGRGSYKMEESQQAHEEEKARERRRGLRPYGLPEGERELDVPLHSRRLGLSGRADLVITTGEAVIPVDYKLSDREKVAQFRLQIASYAVMLEEMRGLPAERGFVYSLVSRRAEEVRVTRPMRAKVEAAAEAVRQMVEREAMPPAPSSRARCLACEYRRFCNDAS